MQKFISRTMQTILHLLLGSIISHASAQEAKVNLNRIDIGFTPRAIAKLGDDIFILTQPLVFMFGNDDAKITVPRGFITDLASIPKALHWWEGKVDRSLAPAILHDYLYWYQPCSPQEADSVMMVGMSAMEMSTAKRTSIYAGTRVAGKKFFELNTELRKNGQVRTFTSEYLDKVLATRVDPKETLDTVVQKAKASSGLLPTEAPLPSDRRICQAVHLACVECR